MSVTYPDLPNTTYPDNNDSYTVYVDVNNDNYQYVKQIQDCIANQDFDGAQAIITAHSELKNVIITAATLQRFEDQIIASQRFYKSNVVDVIANIIKWQGEYSSTASYKLFDIATYNLKAYLCISSNTVTGILPTNTTYWTPVTLQGISGTGMAFYSSWSTSQEYKVQDCCPFGNKLYVCITQNTNHEPDTSPDYWKSVIVVPRQVIWSKNQPENQEEGDIWYQTSDSDNSYKTFRCFGNNSYSQMYPVSNADFIKFKDLSSVQSFKDSKAQPSGIASLDENGRLVQTGNLVQGNTKSWVATVVAADDPIGNSYQTFGLTIPGFVFSEGCSVTFLAPQSVANSVWSNVSINGARYDLRTLAHEMMSGDEWVANTSVTMILSAVKVPLGDNVGRDGTAFFKGGAGSVKDTPNFPLSIQTAAPTPVNTNHIWIHNDAQMNLALDEAIRAGNWDNDNRYYAIVDQIDNGGMDQQAAKKTTGGTAIGFNFHKAAKDNAPWEVNDYTYFTKKYGVNWCAQLTQKWPRIYSRINGVVDMEDAQRWDGSAWQWLSQKGLYLFTGTGTIYNRAAGNISAPRQLVNIVALNYHSCAISPDGLYFFILSDNSGDFQVYKRNGDGFDLISTLPTSQYAICCDVSPDSQYLAIAGGNTKVFIFKKQTDGTWASLTNLTVDYLSEAVAWTLDGSRLIVYCCNGSGDTSGEITIFNRSYDAFTINSTIPYVHGSNYYGSRISLNSNYYAYSHTSASSATIVNISSIDSYHLFSSTTVATNGYGQTTFKMLSNDHMVYIYGTGIYMADVNGTTLFSVTPDSNHNFVSMTVTPDEQYVIAYCNSGYYYIYSIGTSAFTWVSSTYDNNIPYALACL